jgi:hypothetical protein
MKLQQDQVWIKGDDYYRILRLERLGVEYKAMKNTMVGDGTRYRVTKKQFCRLIKGATLAAPPAAPPATPGS